jgi:hypothetical protein
LSLRGHGRDDTRLMLHECHHSNAAEHNRLHDQASPAG